MILRSLQAPNAEATVTIATMLARLCKIGDCLALSGDLGAGKTTFARGFIQALLQGEEVVSPTFTLVQHYLAPSASIYHFDLYRLKHSEELQEIGFEEALQNGTSLIEWPELARGYLPASTLDITFAQDGQGRILHFTAQPDFWQERLEQLGS